MGFQGEAQVAVVGEFEGHFAERLLEEERVFGDERLVGILVRREADLLRRLVLLAREEFDGDLQLEFRLLFDDGLAGAAGRDLGDADDFVGGVEDDGRGRLCLHVDDVGRRGDMGMMTERVVEPVFEMAGMRYRRHGQGQCAAEQDVRSREKAACVVHHGSLLGGRISFWR